MAGLMLPRRGNLLCITGRRPCSPTVGKSSSPQVGSGLCDPAPEVDHPTISPGPGLGKWVRALETVRVRSVATVLWRAGPVWVRCPWSWCSPVLGSPPGSNGGAVAMCKKCFFGIITRKAIRRGSFHNIGGLTRKINAFVEHDNAQARPPNFWQSLPRGGRSEAQGSVQGWHQHWWVLADHPPERFPGHWPADALPRGRT